MARGGDLLTAGEVGVVRAMLALDEPALALYARLSARVPECFARDTLPPFAGCADIEGALERLISEELVDTLVPWDVRAEHSTREALGEACRALGLSASGRHAERVARLQGRRGWSSRRWVRLRHRALLRRLEIWYFGHLYRDRSERVVERLGYRRWPKYPLTSGHLFADRREMLRWESRIGGLRSVSDAALLEWLTVRPDPPGALSLARRARREVAERAQGYERSGAVEEASRLWAALAHIGEHDAVVRWSRTLELSGEPHEALAVLKAFRPRVEPDVRLGVVRAGRRLGRALGVGFPPDAPLREPSERRLELAPGTADGVRPRWRVGAVEDTIEAALVAMLRGMGRAAVHAEGVLWSTLFGILFRDALFLPVPGALPTPCLSCPLDWGTPDFAARRHLTIAAIWEDIERGGGEERLRTGFRDHFGERTVGVAWESFELDFLVAALRAASFPVLQLVFGALLERGLAGLRGLPDLVLLPGPAIALPAAFPSRLVDRLLFVEVKGPTDAVRDGQRVWADRLLDAGALVETWNVRAAPV